MALLWNKTEKHAYTSCSTVLYYANQAPRNKKGQRLVSVAQQRTLQEVVHTLFTLFFSHCIYNLFLRPQK